MTNLQIAKQMPDEWYALIYTRNGELWSRMSLFGRNARQARADAIWRIKLAGFGARTFRVEIYSEPFTEFDKRLRKGRVAFQRTQRLNER